MVKNLIVIAHFGHFRLIRVKFTAKQAKNGQSKAIKNEES